MSSPQPRSIHGPVAAVLAGLVLVGCWGGSIGSGRLAIGAPAPAFSLPALDGSTVESSKLTGKPLVLNFWATWCQPCLKEIPELKALAGSGQVNVVGVALDEEGRSTVAPFVERHQIAYTILLGNQSVLQRFAGFGIPHTVVLDSAWRVLNVYRGPTTRAAIESDIADAAGGTQE